ncbi:MAG: aldehyde dehydrogenase family protein [candidate division Zixibacteria bacterium]|nr:aldehyde dehydrogenase family protein [candidate division Zixibacteria bacterium]
MKKFPLYISGEQSSDGDITITAPFDGSEIATAVSADLPAVKSALATAHALYENRDSWLPTSKRLEILSKAAHIISERVEELTLDAAREGGKPYVDSKVEVIRAIDGIRSCIETIRTDSGRTIPMNLNPASSNRFAFTRREPIGVVVAVSAFNHPFNLIVHQVAPAIAVGCPVIVKPAENTPISCFNFVEILYEAGLPKEWCQAMVIKDLSVATELVTDPRVSFFSFIGSAKVGWMLRSKLAPGARCALEHGGAAPVIVTADADLDKAVPLLAKGGFYHAGQVCVSVQRIFAHKSVAIDLANRLAAIARKQKVGDPTSPKTDVGPLIRPRETDRIDEWVKEALDKGAKLICGGKKISDSCYECTVLLDPPDDVKVSKLEIFGPVICVYSFDDLDEAITRANNVPFAFQAAVFTKDINTAMRAYARLNASAVMVNEHTAFRVDWMPFAGLKQSGLGIGGIPYTIHDMQIEKMMVLRSDEL